MVKRAYHGRLGTIRMLSLSAMEPYRQVTEGHEDMRQAKVGIHVDSDQILQLTSATPCPSSVYSTSFRHYAPGTSDH
jgi:hypothetical protein